MLKAKHLRNVQRAMAANMREIASRISAETEGLMEDGCGLQESQKRLDAQVARLEDCARVLSLCV